MLSINTIARVIVNVVRPAAQPTSWDTELLLVKDAAFADAKRLRTYANSTEAAAGQIADGFDNTTEAYKAAQKYFASSPSPGRLLVSCYSASETSVEALDAILQLTSDFYGIALINARQIRAFLYVDGTNMPRCILRKAGIRPIPDPPRTPPATRAGRFPLAASL